MRPFHAALKPSRSGRALAVLLHIAAFCICTAAFYGTVRTVGLLLLAVSFVWAWHRQNLRGNRAVHKIAVNPQGRATVFAGAAHSAFPAVLCGGSLVSPYALFLKWQLNGRTVHQLVLPDMTERESYRRLLVWARWGQPKDEAV